ncbi:hypothetical protein SSS_08020 [Sarcoptes scabiei]|uniref:Uncharacterized protein n=1 Tax=Sarcoptes scabiei TaxID=52283 RepID=A0A834VJE4_SARSC|nr:hypothetical protein SSS_08020 [Sarcoptes scabiei]
MKVKKLELNLIGKNCPKKRIDMQKLLRHKNYMENKMMKMEKANNLPTLYFEEAVDPKFVIFTNRKSIQNTSNSITDEKMNNRNNNVGIRFTSWADQLQQNLGIDSKSMNNSEIVQSYYTEHEYSIKSSINRKSFSEYEFNCDPKLFETEFFHENTLQESSFINSNEEEFPYF